jgi:hypothetical protein
MTKLFSAFGAADSLEKDRQTVRRALRGVAPDGHEKGQPRWRLTTILRALDRRTREVRDGISPELQEMFAEHERLDAAVRDAWEAQVAWRKHASTFPRSWIIWLN